MARNPTRTIHLMRCHDGSLMDLGRNGTGEHRGEGPSVVYRGEALEVMNLVLKHAGKAPRQGRGGARGREEADRLK